MRGSTAQPSPARDQLLDRLDAAQLHDRPQRQVGAEKPIVDDAARIAAGFVDDDRALAEECRGRDALQPAPLGREYGDELVVESGVTLKTRPGADSVTSATSSVLSSSWRRMSGVLPVRTTISRRGKRWRRRRRMGGSR